MAIRSYYQTTLVDLETGFETAVISISSSKIAKIASGEWYEIPPVHEIARELDLIPMMEVRPNQIEDIIASILGQDIGEIENLLPLERSVAVKQTAQLLLAQSVIYENSPITSRSLGELASHGGAATITGLVVNASIDRHDSAWMLLVNLGVCLVIVGAAPIIGRALGSGLGSNIQRMLGVSAPARQAKPKAASGSSEEAKVRKAPRRDTRGGNRYIMFHDLASLTKDSMNLFVDTAIKASMNKFIIALKNEDDKFVDALLSPFPVRRRKLMKEEIAVGRSSVQAIRQAQRDLLKTAIRLANQGQIRFEFEPEEDELAY